MIELVQSLAIFLIITFFIFFFIQKIIFTYANRMIFRLIPAVILPLFLILGYIAYRIEMNSLFERGAITMAIDSTNIMYTILEIFTFTALIGCLLGIAYVKLKKVLEKTNLFSKGVDFFDCYKS